jgi:hypothetical protein
MVKSVEGRDEWALTDLLGRSMGVISTTDSGNFLIEPDGNARVTMTGTRCGPFPSLDDALAAIETHTRGVCRREMGRPQSGEPRRSEAAEETTETSTDMSEKASLPPR